MCVNNLPKVATQWNSCATWDSNRGRRVLIPSALTTRPPSHTVTTVLELWNVCCRASQWGRSQLIHDGYRDEGHVPGRCGREELGLLSTGVCLSPGQTADLHRLSQCHRASARRDVPAGALQAPGETSRWTPVHGPQTRRQRMLPV